MVLVLVQAHTNLFWRDQERFVNSSREKQENIHTGTPYGFMVFIQPS